MINAFLPHSAFPITPSANGLTETAYGLQVLGNAGTVVYEDMSGQEWTETVQQYGYVTMQVRKVLVASSATGIRGFRLSNKQ